MPLLQQKAPDIVIKRSIYFLNRKPYWLFSAFTLMYNKFITLLILEK